jgi:hypothetical protein
MSDKFAKAVGMADASPTNIEDTLIVARAETPERLTARAYIRLKPSEFKVFKTHIGRQSISDALRALVIEFNARKDN